MAKKRTFTCGTNAGNPKWVKRAHLARLISSKMSKNKSFDVRARFGAVYSASKTKKYLLKNSTIGNQLLFSFLANTEFTRPENSNWLLLLPDSNYF